MGGFLFAKQTVVNWSRFCQDLCVFEFRNDEGIIGGAGCVVEKDGTIVVKWKYNCGRMLCPGWLFGGIKQTESSVFRCFI
jgi:hypothetical protein